MPVRRTTVVPIAAATAHHAPQFRCGTILCRIPAYGTLTANPFRVPGANLYPVIRAATDSARYH